MKKWAVVVAGNKGIGHSAVKALVSSGFSVIGTARTEEGFRAIESAGGHGVLMDMTCARSIATGLTEVERLTGGVVEVLVLNAGVGQPGAIEDVPVGAWRDTFEINVFGPLTVLQSAMPMLRQGKDSRVIWVGSVLGMMGLGFRGAYVATKFAIEGMADVLRIELASAGIHVSVIQPGPVATDFRKTARARFRPIESAPSVHGSLYRSFTKRMEAPDVVKGDTVHPDEVGKVIAKAARANKPNARYRVCRSTTGVEALRRLAPRSFITWIGKRALNKETTGN